MRRALAVLLLAVPCATHAGDVLTGNDALALCGTFATAPGSTLAAQCLGFVLGNERMRQYNTIALEKAIPRWTDPICIPATVTYGQMVRTYVKFLEDNPADLHRPSPALYLDAMLTAFPCK